MPEMGELLASIGYGLRFVQNPVAHENYDYLRNVLTIIQGVEKVAANIK
jgi:hypothetical protein